MAKPYPKKGLPPKKEKKSLQQQMIDKYNEKFNNPLIVLEGIGKDKNSFSGEDSSTSSFPSLKRTPIKKGASAKQRAKIKLNKEYYALAISNNQKQNKGLCVCENCSNAIQNPTGSNVSHIVSAGANYALYLDIENHFILCDICEGHWTMHDKTTMAVYQESEERRIRLNNKYYTNK